MRRRILAAAVLVALTATLAFADDPKAKAAADEKAAMDAMMKAATPGDAHKKLSPMAGTWTTDVKMWMAPGAAPAAGSGTAENTWALDGRWLEQRFNGTFMGMPATNKRYSIEELHLFRIADGRVAEHWHQGDMVGMMRQLGLMPEPGKKA